MSSTVIFVGLPEDSKSSITKTLSECRSAEDLATLHPPAVDTWVDLSASDARVPNAPKSSIGEIFSSDKTDAPVQKNGSGRPRAPRDTPTRPRDTHSRLFGQVAGNNSVAPMITDTIRSNIQFGDSQTNGHVHSPAHSPKQMNGSASSTPSRGEMENGEHCGSTLFYPEDSPYTYSILNKCLLAMETKNAAIS